MRKMLCRVWIDASTALTYSTPISVRTRVLSALLEDSWQKSSEDHPRIKHSRLSQAPVSTMMVESKVSALEHVDYHIICVCPPWNEQDVFILTLISLVAWAIEPKTELPLVRSSTIDALELSWFLVQDLLIFPKWRAWSHWNDLEEIFIANL